VDNFLNLLSSFPACFFLQPVLGTAPTYIIDTRNMTNLKWRMENGTWANAHALEIILLSLHLKKWEILCEDLALFFRVNDRLQLDRPNNFSLV